MKKSTTVLKYVYLGSNTKGGCDKGSESEDGHMCSVG
jgi:hypothetical protein